MPEYRLPKKLNGNKATALVGNREYNIYKGQKEISLEWSNILVLQRQYRGDQLGQLQTREKETTEELHGWSDDGADITNKAKSLCPNDFGLYDMAGNVAEMGTRRLQTNG